MNSFIGGIKNMPLNQKPKFIVVFDATYEKNAIKEANDAGIPVIAVGNTDTRNGKNCHILIPANTSSVLTTELIMGILTDAVAEAKGLPTLVVGKKPEEIKFPSPRETSLR